MYKFEKKYWKNNKTVAGFDEAGRGPMAGPLVVGCVVFPIGYKNNEINDSKKLTPKRRKELSEIIMKDAIEYNTTVISAAKVDDLNPKASARYGMKMCYKKLKTPVDVLLTDFEKIEIDFPQENIVKGDQLSISIAAASIIAKHKRTQLMIKIDQKHPEYGFKKHKGYVTKVHLEAIEKYGIISEHRKSYKPIKNYLVKRS